MLMCEENLDFKRCSVHRDCDAQPAKRVHGSIGRHFWKVARKRDRKPKRFTDHGTSQAIPQQIMMIFTKRDQVSGT